MTEPRKPLVLDFLEWKTLVMHGLAEMNQAVQGSSTIDASGIAWADAKWADIRTRLVGWENYSRPVIAQQKQQAIANEQQQEPMLAPPEATADPAIGESPANGTEPVKAKRGGWPAGKPRGPRKPKAIQPPAVSL